jgi:hypothetical protein
MPAETHKLIPLDANGDPVITEAMVDAAFETQEWKDIERAAKIAFTARNFQPFTHEGWRDGPAAVLFKAMVKAITP